MAKIEMQGMDAYLAELRRLGENTAPVCEAAVYAGAKVVADEIKREIQSLRVVSDKHALAAWQKRVPTLISYTQKKGLLESFGVAPIQNRFGVFSTKCGFDGYNEIQTERWPNGQPNQLIARACESGSSAMLKQPFVRVAEKRVKQAALLAMEMAADKELKKLTGG